MLVAKGTGDDITLRYEALKTTCDELKDTVIELQKSVKILQSTCELHERTLEMLRKQTAGFQRDQNSLDLRYRGEQFELME